MEVFPARFLPPKTSTALVCSASAARPSRDPQESFDLVASRKKKGGHQRWPPALVCSLRIVLAGDLSGSAKSCGQLLGESWPRAIRSGTGRGGDVTGSRVSVKSLVIAGAGGGNRRTAVAERDPHIGVALRLPLDEAVSGLGPGHDGFVLVVENELALFGLPGQNRVAF